VHEDHDRQPPGALRDAELSCERRRLRAGLVAGEELLIREREGLERVQLDADGHVLCGKPFRIRCERDERRRKQAGDQSTRHRFPPMLAQ
jgi:hypothetical protein